jgi:hypothetical protein
MRISANRRRVDLLMAELESSPSRKLACYLDSRLPYWERSFKHDPVERKSDSSQNQCRVDRIGAILQRSRAFGKLLDNALWDVLWPVSTF